MIVATSILVALAILLLAPAPASRQLQRLTARPRASRSPLRLVWWVPTLCGALLVVAVTGRLGWAASSALLLGVGTWLFRRSRHDRRVRVGNRETARAATTLALLMRSGLIPGQALREAAKECPVLTSAAAASHLGASVADALAHASREPGREGLSDIAAAWTVSHTTGASVAAVVARVAETLREQHQVQAVITSEISAARMSARVMACLPFLALGLGALMGTDPLGFYGQDGLSEVLLVAGVALSVAGVVWTEKLVRVVRP